MLTWLLSMTSKFPNFSQIFQNFQKSYEFPVASHHGDSDHHAQKPYVFIWFGITITTIYEFTCFSELVKFAIKNQIETALKPVQSNIKAYKRKTTSKRQKCKYVDVNINRRTAKTKYSIQQNKQYTLKGI